MRKYLITAIGLCIASLAIAQNNAIFYGGIGDGHVVGSYSQSSVLTFAQGGQGDGHVAGNYSQTTALAYARGGQGDGHAANSYSQNTATSLFTGGIGDGFSDSNYVQPTNLTFARGGIGDGFSNTNYVQPTDLTFARGGIGDGWANVALLLTPVPVELVSFSGSKIPEGHLLTWVTGNEDNIAQYQLQRSQDSRSFHTLNEQAAQANGASTQTNYRYLDRNPTVGNNFYRLAIKEHNGKTVYSNVVLLKVSADGQSMVTLYPNPTATALHVQLDGINAGTPIAVQVMDVTGKVVLKQAMTAQAIHTIDVKNFAAGGYLLMLQYQGRSEVIKFIKQ